VRFLRRPFYPAAAAITGLALWLRLYRLSAQELWVDEAFSYLVATLPTGLDFALVDPSPPLFYALLALWVPAVGASEFAVRLLPALLGTAGVAGLIGAGRAIVNRRVGLWGGLFAAVAPTHVYYSQEARAYALLMSAILLALWAFWRAYRRNRLRDWVLAALAAALALGTHYLALPALAATVYLFAGVRESRRRLRHAAALCAAALAVLPWTVSSLSYQWRVLGGGPPIDWMRSFWEETPPILAIPKSLEILGLGAQPGLIPLRLKVLTQVEFPPALRLLGLAILVALGIAAARSVAVALRRREGGSTIEAPGDPGPGDGPDGRVYVVVALLLPLVLLWLTSWVRPIYVVGRSDVIVFPAYALCVGIALDHLQRFGRSWIRPGPWLLLLLLVPIGWKLHGYYAEPAADWQRRTAVAVSDRVDSGDVVLFAGLRGAGVLYYLDRLGTRWRDGLCVDEVGRRKYGCRLFPLKTEVLLAGRPAGGSARSAGELAAELEELLRDLDAERGGRVFVAYEAPTGPPPRLDELLQLLGFERGGSDSELRIAVYANGPR